MQSPRGALSTLGTQLGTQSSHSTEILFLGHVVYSTLWSSLVLGNIFLLEISENYEAGKIRKYIVHMMFE